MVVPLPVDLVSEYVGAPKEIDEVAPTIYEPT